MSTTSPTSQDASTSCEEPPAEHQAVSERDWRRRRGRRVAVPAAVAALVAAAAIVLSVVGTSTNANLAAATARMQRVLAGIPQHGLTLGNPSAPVTVTEFADLQCPYCARFTLTMLPGLLTHYVEPGKVKMVFQALSFLGGDSATAGRAALAASAQDRLWSFVDAFYYNQRAENSGYVTQDFLRTVGSEVPGLNVGRMMIGYQSASTIGGLHAAAAHAKADGVKGTPTFIIQTERGGSVRVLGTAKLQAALDRALAG